LKQIRKRLTYANVMSSLAVFLILGGATAFAAVSKVGANEIKANSIKTGKIVKEAVTAGKLKNAAVTEAKIADGAVTTNKLADNAVTAPKIAKDAVTTEKVLNNAVTNGKIANDAVTTAKLANGAVTSAKLGANSVEGAQVKAGSLQASNISTFETTVTLNFPSIPAGTCDRELAGVAGSGNTADDSVLVTANADDLILAPEGGGLNLVVLGQGSNAGSTYRVVLCNPSAAAVDPPSTRFYVTAFAR
jgi:hypothetical protein